MAITPFTKKLVETAQQQYQLYKSMDEADAKLCKQIQKYYTDLGFTFTSCVDEPWSAVFISWCVLKGGANATEFKFAVAHSKFVYKAIQNATHGAGVFRARKLNDTNLKSVISSITTGEIQRLIMSTQRPTKATSLILP